ncbi:IS3 family transposase [Streptomyces cathayae]|uniref:IS3 family transposase n=1 Tax=Streptomyces cathayae TaxID=3031124 RepID=UPI003C6EF570
MRDTELKKLIRQVHTDNHRVHGARKIWREPTRRGHQAARRTAERLLREPGSAGAVRGKRVLTTMPDQQAERAPGRVDRDFAAGAPNRCRAGDLTHAATWPAVVHLAFALDTFSRRIAGRLAATPKEPRLVLDTLKTALWQRDRDEYPYVRGELTHHSDADSQYTGVRPPDTRMRPASRPRPDLPATRTTTPRGRARSARAKPNGSSRSGPGRPSPHRAATAGVDRLAQPPRAPRGDSPRPTRRGRGRSLQGIQETPGHNHNVRSLPNPGRFSVLREPHRPDADHGSRRAEPPYRADP